ncbi:hypothetical protein [Planobispora longispora]|uniref:Uncharacterized protein n=1 Tax=Planobispora longispora TaxID=28887 RepID=A0A8J3RHT8_9ACTN|nr:hypothetical protein [Planobispora longispora]GIH75134.1 hypothetical protein Plo01_15630 [Planobispora longispora]
MKIRIDGTRAEVVHAVNKIRRILPIGSVSPVRPLPHRPYTWRVYLDTAPKRDGGGWIT